MLAPQTEPQFAIEARGLDKTYSAQGKGKATHALKSVDLVVPRGSFFGLLGPNGAGKSTFINILGGLVVKSGGTAKIWGHDITTDPMNARGAIGIVPQELNMDPFFTPGEALEIQAGYYGVPKAERRTEEILKAVGLWDKRDAYARTLSGGMKRRLLVAKAMVHAPPVLVLDEPTAGVDVELRRQLWDYVRSLHASGVTIVLTTHYLEEAQELCDTIAIINHGNVIACEPTHKLISRLDQKTLVVTPQTPVAPPLKGFEDFTFAMRPTGAFAITYRTGEHSVEEMLDRVRNAGISIKDLSIEEPDLEDVFVQLTA
ncbi:ABC transporter ATP-binding protein [Terricaulis sp.]|uniref:ABC transporter ATP-binding protein n=1 Tax=Terricaulis sp. TaxID=2768686 RepID=UPI002AC57E09|nr:ABC transporter ATP-binding protein [Terricaulis sp.]MDZ4691915.1 ABC transporter ATP-binding protein [Terricaulis sp.]